MRTFADFARRTDAALLVSSGCRENRIQAKLEFSKWAGDSRQNLATEAILAGAPLSPIVHSS